MHQTVSLAEKSASFAGMTLLLLLLAASLVWYFQWNATLTDVTAYWRAGANLLQGENIYAPPPPGPSPKAFLYPPTFATIFSILTILPPAWGYAMWMALHFVFLVVLVLAASRLAGISSRSAWLRYVVLLLVWLPAAVGGDFQEGQVNLLVVALVASALWKIEEGRIWSGGALLAMAAHIKLLPLALLAPLFVQGRWRAVAATGLFVAALVFLPALVTVPREGLVQGITHALTLHADFARTVFLPAVSDAKVMGEEQFYILNNSLIAVLHRLFAANVAFSPFPQVAALWQSPLLWELPRAGLRLAAAGLGGLLFVGAVALAYAGASDRRSRAASFGLTVIAVELATLNGWEHHLVGLVLTLAPLAAVAGGTQRMRRIGALLSAAVIALWTGPYLLAPFAALAGAQSPAALLETMRAWGAPTALMLGLFGLSLAVHFPRQSRFGIQGRSSFEQGSRT